jgi:hypothetical protein
MSKQMHGRARTLKFEMSSPNTDTAHHGYGVRGRNHVNIPVRPYLDTTNPLPPTVRPVDGGGDSDRIFGVPYNTTIPASA